MQRQAGVVESSDEIRVSPDGCELQLPNVSVALDQDPEGPRVVVSGQAAQSAGLTGWSWQLTWTMEGQHQADKLIAAMEAAQLVRAQ